MISYHAYAFMKLYLFTFILYQLIPTNFNEYSSVGFPLFLNSLNFLSYMESVHIIAKNNLSHLTDVSSYLNG